MGLTWGPPGSCWPQVGLMLALWTLLLGMVYGMLIGPLLSQVTSLLHHWHDKLVWYMVLFDINNRSTILLVSWSDHLIKFWSLGSFCCWLFWKYRHLWWQMTAHVYDIHIVNYNCSSWLRLVNQFIYTWRLSPIWLESLSRMNIACICLSIQLSLLKSACSVSSNLLMLFVKHVRVIDWTEYTTNSTKHWILEATDQLWVESIPEE